MRSGAEGLSESSGEGRGDVRARFAALRAHPRTRELLAAPLPEPEPTEGPEEDDDGARRSPGPLVGIGVLIAIVALLLFTTGLFALMCPPLMALPLAGLLVLFLVFLRSQGSGPAHPKHVERFPALVMETSVLLRTGTSGDSERRGAVELLFADGVQREFQARASLADALEPNRMGVATLAGSRLVGFEAVDA